MNFKIIEKINKVLQISGTSSISIIFFSFLFLVLTFLEIFSITAIGVLVQNLIKNEKSQLFNFSFIEETLLFFNEYIFLIIIILFFFKALFSIFINYTIYKYTLGVTSILRIKITNSYFTKRIKLYSNFDSTEIINSINNYCEDFYQIFFLIHKTLAESILSIFLISYLFFLNPRLLVVFILLIIVFFIFYNFFLKKNISHGKKINNDRFQVTSILKNIFDNFLEVFTYNKINYFIRLLTISSNNIAKNQTKIKIISSSPRVLLEFFLILSVLVFFYYNKNDITDLLAFLTVTFLIVIRLIPVSQQFLNFISSINSTKNSIDRLNDILESDFTVNHFDRLNNNSLVDIKNFTIFFDNNLLINQTISKSILITSGDWIAISGKTGSGKTTLIECIMGIRDSNTSYSTNLSSKIIDSAELIQFSSYVPQSTSILNGSLLFNLTLSQDPIEDSDFHRIHNIIKITKLDFLVHSFPNKYKQTLGENGRILSGGEKQRIFIARALFFNKKLLFLDESTTGLNSQIEFEILENIKKHYPDKIIFLISHNNNLLKLCNKSISLDNEL
jgi:ATP-binding cassette, subfamily B, bacterial PglK